MMPRSIRFRLTSWYFSVLLLALIAFGIGTWLIMRRSLYESVDDSLRDRVSGVRRFMEVQIEALSLDEIRQEFREHSVLGPGGDLFQVCDGKGSWLYRSSPLADNDVPILMPDRLPEQGWYEVRTVQKTLLRLLSRKVLVRGQPYTVQVAASVDELAEALDRYRWALSLLVPAALLVASLGGYWMSRRALAPVDAIIKDAKSISAHNIESRLEVLKTGDELQRLSETLNEMLNRLNAAFKRVTQFTADASHELRTPVALVRATAEIALRKKRPAEEYEEALGQILQESERTTGLIENLLTLTRADARQEKIELQKLDLREPLQDAVRQAQILAAAKDVEVLFSLPEAPVTVLGNAQALRRLALILLDNAVKYSVPGGKVELDLHADSTEARFRVKDNGEGISEADLPHIFERFYRADQARSREMGGAGLGLAIGQWIAQSHGGGISVESRIGEGSVFSVTLPWQAIDP
jgi:heavy metal sensor kinase